MSKKLQPTRRHVLKGVAATGAAIAAAPYIGYAQAAEGPIRAGFSSASHWNWRVLWSVVFTGGRGSNKND